VTSGLNPSTFSGWNLTLLVNQLKNGWLVLSLAMIDIDNDGRPEPVLKFRKGSCINHHAPFDVQYQSLVVLQTDRATIDRRKTGLVMQNPSKHKICWQVMPLIDSMMPFTIKDEYILMLGILKNGIRPAAAV
jgi:hypothetical protein